MCVLEGSSSNLIDAFSQTHSRSLAISLARKVYFQKPLEKAVLQHVGEVSVRTCRTSVVSFKGIYCEN